MGNYVNILKRKAVRGNRNGKYTFTEVGEIRHKLRGFSDHSKESIVLYKPDDHYWILLTEDSIVFFRDNEVHEILYAEIDKDDVYFHDYRNYHYNGETILCDHIKISKKQGGAPIIFPIEVLSVFSFSEPLNFVLTKINS